MLAILLLGTMEHLAGQQTDTRDRQGRGAVERLAAGLASALPAPLLASLREVPRAAARGDAPIREFHTRAPSARQGSIAAGDVSMSLKTSVGKTGDLARVEEGLGLLIRKIRAAAHPESGTIASFEAKVASEWTRHLFLEQWCGLAIAPGIAAADRSDVLAWGLQAWPPTRGVAEHDEAFQVSIPSLLALQRGATVTPERDRSATVDATRVRRYVAGRRGGLLGQASGHWRCLVEFDPEEAIAAVLGISGDRRGAFLKLVREILDNLQVGSLGRRQSGQDIGHRRTALEFLWELHMNGWEYASGARGVRVMRLAKHLYGGRDDLQATAGSFRELSDYIGRQPAHGAVNLVEASVSDFGPGILGGFLATDAGRSHRERDRAELLDELLHRKLSSKISDPNAGLGISNALRAAKAMYAFVSLRTGEFWLTMDGSSPEPGARLTMREGRFEPVVGTHWQLLYPDMTPSGGAS